MNGKFLVIIDNGHGVDTPGKSSPDGNLKEYQWTREMARELKKRLTEKGIKTELLVTEEVDIPLNERVRRVNAFCRLYGASNCLLISLHVDASGVTAQWRQANGWSVYVAPNASSASKEFADLLAQQAIKAGIRVRKQYADRGYWVKSLAIVRDTLCPAVLTENLFMDNHSDCDRLLSNEGKETIVRLHFEAVTEWLSKKERA